MTNYAFCDANAVNGNILTIRLSTFVIRHLA